LRHFERRRGFSLVELLVVIAIIGALIAILMPTLARAREEARRIQCMSNVRTLTAAWIMYANENKGRICSSNIQVDSGLPAPSTGLAGISYFQLAGFPSSHDPTGVWSWIALARNPRTDPLAVGIYVNDAAGGVLWPYLKATRPYACPNKDLLPNSSYAINALLAGVNGSTGPKLGKTLLNISQIKRADQTFVFVEEQKWGQSVPVSHSFGTPNSMPSAFGQGDTGFLAANHPSGGSNGTTISFVDGHSLFWQYADAMTAHLDQYAAMVASKDDANQLRLWSGRDISPH
jgi:prepilin-type N-terminal cleavage/methylation domain-containing protein